MQKIAFLADETQEAQRALDVLSRSYGSVSTAKADVIVALGQGSQAPAILAAWIPAFFPVFISTSILLYLEDG